MTLDLTREDEEFLNGERGPAFQKAMEVLVALGEIYGAEKLIKVGSVHLSGVSYRTGGETGIRFLKWLSDEGASFRVQATLNPHAIEHDRWREVGFTEEQAERQLRNTSAFTKLGALGTYTCTPYLVGNLPRLGEHIAWSESSALSYANSVLGARTNREGSIGAIAAGLIGKTPLYGYHLDENRRGTVLVRVESELRHSSDYSALGFNVGGKVDDRLPIFTNIPRDVKSHQLKALSAALAVSGSVAMYHVVGVTPEAPELESALGGERPAERLTVDSDEIARTYEERSTKGEGSEVDLVVLGCPHYGYEEIRETSIMLKGKKVRDGVRLWICTSTSIEAVARRTGYTKIIEDAGGRVMCSFCPAVSSVEPFGFKTVATNSTKATYYCSGLLGVDTLFGSLTECIEAATTGKWSLESN